MPELKKGKDCCGCTACYAVCPTSAITMQPDDMGFKYPRVDYDKCIECKQCERVCSFEENYKTPGNFASPLPLGVRLKNRDELMKSRSGGAFKAVTDLILSCNGIIYGAAFDKDFKIIHHRADSHEERDKLRGSKYVQSDLKDTFKSVLKDLKEDRIVLFSGTPCQTSGLASFIPHKLHKNLILVDIVCHGVPSPSIWKDFKSYIQRKEGSEIISVDFRDKKSFGWKDHKETFGLRNGRIISGNAYTYLFYRHIMLRPSCGKCYFTNTRRPSDLTLADFWGWEKTDHDFNSDDLGASLLLVNTPKGKEIWEKIKDECNVIYPVLKDCLQPNLIHPSELNPLSEQFSMDYKTKGFKYVLRHYGNENFRFKLRRRLSGIKNKIKRIVSNS